MEAERATEELKAQSELFEKFFAEREERRRAVHEKIDDALARIQLFEARAERLRGSARELKTSLEVSKSKWVKSNANLKT